MKEKALVFPVDESNLFIADIKDVYRAYNLVFGTLSIEFSMNYKFSNIVDRNLLKSIDKVIFIESKFGYDYEGYNHVIELVKELNIQIILNYDLYTHFNLHNYKNTYIYDNYELDKNKSSLDNISIPVIGVFNTGKNCEQFKTELFLRKFFSEKGYKVTQIGGSSLGAILGIKCNPNFLYKNKLSIADKIFYYNKFINSVKDKENSDLIIIGIPESVVHFNKDIDNGYGIIPLIISNAISFDIGIVSIHSNMANINMLKYLIELCKYKYNFKLDYFAVSGTVISYDKETGSLVYSFSESNSSVSGETFQNEGVKLYNTSDLHEMNNSFKMIMEKLQNNVEFIN